jgi:ABC-type multidrug transport system fused ATPase/permease subunit
MNQPEIDPPMGESNGRIIVGHATIGWPIEDREEGDTTVSLAFTLKDLHFEPPQGQMTIVCGPLGAGKTLLVSRHYNLEPATLGLHLISSSEVYLAKLGSWKEHY